MSDEKATFMMRVANAQARADGKREPFPTPINCPHCAYERQFPGFRSGGRPEADQSQSNGEKGISG